MLLTNIFIGGILLAKSEEGNFRRLKTGFKAVKPEADKKSNSRRCFMIDIYEEIANLDAGEYAIGVSPLAYVSLVCAR